MIRLQYTIKTQTYFIENQLEIFEIYISEAWYQFAWFICKCT